MNPGTAGVDWRVRGWHWKKGLGSGPAMPLLCRVVKHSGTYCPHLENKGYRIYCLNFKSITINDINERNQSWGLPWGPKDTSEPAGSSLWSSPHTSPSFLLLRHGSPILGSAQLQFLRDPQRFSIPSGGLRDSAEACGWSKSASFLGVSCLEIWELIQASDPVVTLCLRAPSILAPRVWLAV